MGDPLFSHGGSFLGSTGSLALPHAATPALGLGEWQLPVRERLIALMSGGRGKTRTDVQVVFSPFMYLRLARVGCCGT